MTDLAPPPLQSSPTRALSLAIKGMTCAACAARIEKGVSKLDGVVSANVNLVLERADVSIDPARTNLAAVLTTIRETGYDAHILNPDEPVVEDGDLVRREAWAVLVATLLTAPLVVQMIAHTFGLSIHVSPWAELALATPVQFVLGARFYVGGFRALKARSANMDVLVALGTSAAYFYSLALTVNNAQAAAGQLYFEGSSVIITLVLAGKWLEARAKRGTTEAIRALMALRPETARVIRNEQEIEIGINKIQSGETIVIRPGEKIPTDGVILEGLSTSDESLMTGESNPVDKQPGESVIAGAINGSGRLIVRATAIGQDTTLAKIIAIVQSAQSGKASVQRLVDRISAVFVPVILVISVLTFAAWLMLGSTFDAAFISAISVLVIACPCALGLATPTALVTGLGAAARAGILIKDIEALERIHAVSTVVFDKTGTLTVGKPVITRMITLAGDEHENLSLAASLQNASEHPLARAILTYAKDHNAILHPVAAFKNHPGFGVEGRVAESHMLMGNESFARTHNITVSLPDDWADQTVVILAVDRKAHAIFAIADALRPKSKIAIKMLHHAGYETWMLSGDRDGVAQRIGRELGIGRIKAGVKPDQKAREIEGLRQAGKVVAMVGDGVNDAPALAAADVGIAMGTGTDVAMATAGITLLRPDPRLVPAAIDIGQATWRKIRENLFWAFVYNLIGVPLAAFGFLTPALAGAAMALSSVSVVTNSLRLKRWRARLDC
jgi:P-type Cu+ transporter